MAHLGENKVLIVEDNSLFRQIVKEFLCAHCPGVVVFEAENVAEGFRQALAHRPGAVILDIGLPDGSGLDLAERLRSALPDAAVAVCTSHDLPEYRQAARRCGVEAFFTKQNMDLHAIERFVRGAAAGRGWSVPVAPAPSSAADLEGPSPARVV